MDFENYFNQELLKGKIDKKFVLIIGSGIHKQAFREKKNILSDWETLLKSVSKNVSLSNNYILDFESIVVAETRKQKSDSASKIELVKLKSLSSNIINFKVNKYKLNYPLRIFNSNCISDVINLNFDIVVEKILSNYKINRGRYSDHNLDETGTKKSPILNSMYYEINGIKFWHPHGSVLKPDSILLGLRKYSKSAKEVEQLRIRYKSKTDGGEKFTVDGFNWFDALVQRPIIICGTSLSDSEWDIWLAIVNRFRNYAKHPQKEQPIFIMTGGKSLKRNCLNNFIKAFRPVSSNACSYNEEWLLLEKLLGDCQNKNLT
ncbi:MAG: hypothetical protein RL516_175 [Bacteroidota bacterium]|jgi:hypothetical protein